MKKLNIFLGVLFAVLFVLFSVFPAYAQFGKNNVHYNYLDQVYKSHRFDVMHNLDLKDPVQEEYLRQVVHDLESARDWMGSSRVFSHNIDKRVTVHLYQSFTDMETSNLIGGFAPEGLGALVDGERKRMVLRGDFSRPLGRAIRIHELVHEFQMDIYDPNIIQKVVSSVSLPNGYFEGCAEFLAGLYDPHTRDDIRRREQRNYAANPKSLPTWEVLSGGQINPYTMWSMIPEFLEDKFSAGVAFCTKPLKNKIGLGEFIYDTMKGELGNPDINSERFDQLNRHYWGTEKGLEVQRINRPEPYEENDNFRGRTITPYGHPYPTHSPIRSPDGMQIAAFTIQKNGFALVRYTIPKEVVYLSKQEREKAKKGNILKRLGLEQDLVKNLTPQLPPVPWEHLVVQGFETGTTFNGFDAAWSRDGKQIAFFARINRDHALVIINADTGEIIKKIEFELPGFQLYQAFSPSFNSDGKKIVFSAAWKISRDLYSVDLESGDIINLTSDERFDTAPAVSPDGSKVVYVGSDGDFQHLFLLHLVDGRKEQLTFGEFNDSSPSWSDDGSTLIYTSDEADTIWNLYTLDLKTRTVSQRTEFMGQVETPLFAQGSLDRAYTVVFHDDDQYRDIIYDNFEIFEIEFKKPIRQYTVVVDKREPNSFTFNPSRDLLKPQLDSNQLLNPTKPSEGWGCGGGGINIGLSSLYGMFGQSYFGCSNLLETKHHLGQFASYGSYRIFDYSYQNQEKRTSWRLGAHHNQFPYYFKFYDVVKRYPKQVILNNTWMKESSFDFSTQYPLNKFNRWELFSRLRHRSFNVFGFNVADIDEKFLSSFIFPTDQDIQMFRFLKGSNGSNLSFGAAYVRDTVLYSSNVQGPWHGNALRAQVEVAPPLGKEFDSYVSTKIEARTYRRLSDSVVFAGRVDVMTNSRANGDFMLLCGPERGRGCDYGSIAGNEVVYGSVELRFPIPGTYVFFQGIRGFLFGDAAYARFSNAAQFDKTSGNVLGQKLKTYGFGAQYTIPFIGLPAQSVWRRNNGKWEPTFYITMSW